MDRAKVWFFIVNPKAGSGKTISRWEKAQRIMHNSGIIYRAVKTQYAGHAEQLTAEAVKDGFRRFVAVGGDGTAHDILNGLARCLDAHSEMGLKLSDFTLGVFPIGSGNDWVRSAGISHDFSDIVRIMQSESFGAQDVVRATFLRPDDNVTPSPVPVHYMLNVGGIGFDSRVCERVNEQKALGVRKKMIYFKALLKVLSHFYSFPCKVIADGETVFEGPCYSIAFGIGMWSGGGMRQTPEAVLDDGLLDMMIVPQIPISKLLPQVPRLLNGKLRKAVPLISMHKAKSITVLPTSELLEQLELDGEVPGHFPVRLDVLDDQINILKG